MMVGHGTEALRCQGPVTVISHPTWAMGIIGRGISTLHQPRHTEPLHIWSREDAASYLPFDAAVNKHQDARE